MLIETSFLFFTGKGGVGKTTLSCATAVDLANSGKRVLLVSTDPASNLSDVLQSNVDDKISKVGNLGNLFAINIDPEASAEEYRQRAVKPFIGIASDSEIQKIKEGLSGACTIEIASFDEFSRFIAGDYNGEHYDVIIFDTAPTGHTLRLLELPAAWSSFTEENPDGASCLGPTSALKSSQERYNKVVNRLRDSKLTTINIVARPDKASLKEASRTSDELKELGMMNQTLMINGIFEAIDLSDPLATKIQNLSREQLNFLPENLTKLQLKLFPLLPYNVLGIEKLSSLFDTHLQERIVKQNTRLDYKINNELQGLDSFVDELISKQQQGLIMTMGKGGVGKTITASAIAILLAQKGMTVHLTTTDPAAHILDFINQLDSIPSNLTIDKIDPKVETQVYIDKVMASKGKNLNDNEKNLLLEDLKSPCTEEVAVFHAFSKAIHDSKRKFVVMDTAPTGHTLLLLDTTGSYHKDILRNSTMNKDRIKTPYMMLQDINLCKILLVSLPETTPMREAEALQNDLKRAGIKPYAWVVNQCLSMVEGLKDPLLQSRANEETKTINNIQNNLTDKVYGIEYIAEKNLLTALLDGYK